MTKEQIEELIKKAALYDEIKKREAEQMDYIKRRVKAEQKDLHKIAWFY